MELRHFRYFKVVAELQHFHKAAEKLCITQPALSNQIKQLETELNTKLFVRSGRNVKLSESGEIVLSSANRLLNEIALLKESVNDIESGQLGSLKIGVLQSINALYLRNLVAEFDRKHPHIALQIEEMTNRDIEKKLVEGDIDIGIGFILQKDYPKIEFEILFYENWKLILHRSHANIAQNILQGEKHNLKAILLSEQFETRKIVDNFFTDNRIEYTNITTVNTISSILSLVENGQCFSILPEAFSVLKLNPKLALFDLTPQLPPRTIGLLLAKDRLQKKTVRQFSLLIRNQLSDLND
ncbi:MAG: LysR family transcriptional regulator [Methylophaga sp.]|nr:MAG: LysR family transcriptional regulator [Methylophaga sp.]